MKTEYKWLLIIIASFAVATGVAYLVHHHIQDKDKSEESVKKASKDKDKSESRKKASKDNNRQKSNDYSYDDDYYYDDDDYYYDDNYYYDDDDDKYYSYDDEYDYSYDDNSYSIEDMVTYYNGLTPIELINGLTINNVYLSQNNVVAEFMFDEDELGDNVSCLRDPSTKKDFKEAFLLSEDNDMSLRSACSQFGYDLILRFYGSNTYDRVDIKFSSYEL